MSGSDKLPPPPFERDFEVTVELTRGRSRGTGKRPVIPTIRVVAGPDMLRFASLSPGEELEIGRDERGGLVLSHPSVSRNHARLRCGPDNTITVDDLGSTNGTSVNSVAVRRSVVAPGDSLEIGAVSLRLDLLDMEEIAHLSRVQARLRAADRDPLTGLATRTWMDRQLPVVVERSDATDQPLSLIFGDVDHFKRVNDTFGHGVGDEVLSGVARLILLGIRDSDQAVRYGGEEIAVFLPGSNAVTTADIAERLRTSIAGHDWERTANGLAVSISFGVATRRPGESVRDFMDRADKALYAAKRGGRNRIRLAE